jgi:hypothetical protein
VRGPGKGVQGTRVEGEASKRGGDAEGEIGGGGEELWITNEAGVAPLKEKGGEGQKLCKGRGGTIYEGRFSCHTRSCGWQQPEGICIQGTHL